MEIFQLIFSERRALNNLYLNERAGTLLPMQLELEGGKRKEIIIETCTQNEADYLSSTRTQTQTQAQRCDFKVVLSSCEFYAFNVSIF